VQQRKHVDLLLEPGDTCYLCVTAAESLITWQASLLTPLLQCSIGCSYFIFRGRYSVICE